MRPVNLLPDQFRPHQSGGLAGSAYLVIGVLAVLLVMALAYVMTGNSVTDREGKAATAKAEADTLQARSKQLSPFGDFAQIKQTRIASVRQLAEGRFDWERFMREVALVLPEGSWLRSANASVTGEIDSAAPTPAAAAGATAGPKANLQGCTRKQSEVAKMMVRIGSMHRVTDVELNESKRADQATTVSADNCGRFYAFDVTVSFDPAEPVDETPPGAKRVPADLGGGS